MSEVKNISLTDINNITGLNDQHSIYKYDCKNGMAVFTRNPIKSSEINKTISNCMEEYQEVANSYSIKSSGGYGDRPSRMGGMGGMGGETMSSIMKNIFKR